MSESGITRRNFVQGSALTAFAMMHPKIAFGSDANNRMKVGVVGLGARGRLISYMLLDHGGYEIHAGTDYFEQVSQGVGGQLGIDASNRFSGLSGYKRVIDSGIEAIFLETPSYCFPDHVEAAVDAGLHVFIAKPLACDVPGNLRVEAAAQKAQEKGLVFLVDFQTRTDPLYSEGIRRMHAGEIGKQSMVFTDYADGGFSDPELTENIESRLQHLIWVNDNAIGGGYMVNAGVHAVDVGLWMLGERRPISAMGSSHRSRKNPNGDSHDVHSVTYQFEDDLIMNYRSEHLGNQYDYKCNTVGICTDGHLSTEYIGEVRMPGNEAFEGGEVINLYQGGALRNVNSFYEYVREGDHSNPSVMPSLNATYAAILGRDAAERRGLLTWDEMFRENRSLEVDLRGLKD